MVVTNNRPAYSLESVGYRVAGRSILDDVTFDIPYGGVLALVGPNGAGKSTLLSVLTGDVAASTGAVNLDGRPLAAWSARDMARIRGVLLQMNSVAFSFTAAQVIEMGRAPWVGASSASEDEAIIASATAQADVGALLGRSFGALSGGEKARVSLARVLAQDTRIVLLDEPTAALDLRHQEDVLMVARDLAARGRAVVVVLHDLSLAAAYCDEIAILQHGRLVAIGDPRTVLTEALIEEVYETPVRVIADPDTGRPVVLPRRSAK